MNNKSYKIKKEKDIKNKDELDFKFFIPSKFFVDFKHNLEESKKIKDEKKYDYARKVIIGNIPSKSVFLLEDLIEFLNNSFILSNSSISEGNPITNYFYHEDQRFVVIELRSIEETKILLSFNGLVYKNKTLKMRKPLIYYKKQNIKIDRKIPFINLKNLKINKISNKFDYKNKIKIENIPKNIEEEFIFDLLNKFGEVKSFEFNYLKENKFNTCFFEFINKEKYFKLKKYQIVINGFSLKFIKNKYEKYINTTKMIHFNLNNDSVYIDNEEIKIKLGVQYSKTLRINSILDEKFKGFCEKFGKLEEFNIINNETIIKFEKIEASILLFNYLEAKKKQ